MFLALGELRRATGGLEAVLLNAHSTSIVTCFGYIASAIFLSIALKKLPIGTAYAMWTGFGIVGTSLLGIILFRETLTSAQIGCVALIAIGVVGLKVLA